MGLEASAAHILTCCYWLGLPNQGLEARPWPIEHSKKCKAKGAEGMAHDAWKRVWSTSWLLPCGTDMSHVAMHTLYATWERSLMHGAKAIVSVMQCMVHWYGRSWWWYLHTYFQRWHHHYWWSILTLAHLISWQQKYPMVMCVAALNHGNYWEMYAA